MIYYEIELAELMTDLFTDKCWPNGSNFGQSTASLLSVTRNVATDEMRKALVLSVAPANVAASAVSVDKMIQALPITEIWNDNSHALFENPEDIVRLVEGGVDPEEVNVGGMRFDVARKQITKSVSVNDTDIAAFRKLKDLGVKNELRQLPGDTSQDFNDI